MTTPPPSALGPPPGGMPTHSLGIPLDQNHSFVGLTTMLLVLCLIAVSMRMLARRMQKIELGADDYAALISLSIFIGLAIEQYLLAYYNVKVASNTIPSSNDILAKGKLQFASSLTGLSLFCVTKLSVLFLYRRIFILYSPRFRRAWYASVTLVVVQWIAFFVQNLFPCSPRPLKTLWREPGKCTINQTAAAAQGFTNAATDFILLMLPIHVVWRLHMSRRMKVGVGGIFALGLIGVAISFARAIFITSPNLFSNGGLVFIIWSTTDPAVALICACLPVVPPVLAAFWKKTKKSFSHAGRWSGPDRPAHLESESRYDSKAALQHEMGRMTTWTSEERSLSHETLRSKRDIED